jgi:hypothetical protein
VTAKPHPWEDEPDSLEAESCGFTIRLRRNTELGTWCGYVVIPEYHPWHGCSYGDLVDVSVHGGVTYSGDEVFHQEWAVGFDCGHAFDLIPMLASGKLTGTPLETETGTYRDIGYALDEARHLAEQAHKAQRVSTDPLDRTDDELRQALRALRGEAEPEPAPSSPTYTRMDGETDAAFKRRIIEDNARVAAGMAPRRRSKLSAGAAEAIIDDPERKDPW